jgi:hypothetical protein
MTFNAGNDIVSVFLAIHTLSDRRQTQRNRLFVRGFHKVVGMMPSVDQEAPAFFD